MADQATGAVPVHPPRTRFILIEPSHAGNVGAAARAVKVMGFSELALVNPRWPNVLARQEAIERASGATDVLQAARVAATLDEALEGMTHLCATVMTPRDFGPPTTTPRAHFDALLPGDAPSQWPEGVAFLFGPERYGMSNADVYRCHAALSIPSNPAFGSLNLAAAVQLIAYDWRQALIARGMGYGAAPASIAPAAPRQRSADAAQVAGLLAHWEQALVHLQFLDPQAPRKLMPRLAQLFNRAGPTVEEIDILRGIARAMEQATPRQH
ncbi:MAG: RNA methyltransferase [Burkholderiaceae bacterium]|jgi:tRNA/rRNA methyltransferase|nr:RNA methyltransferase [Burkholderiaceae bacterium]